jgi:hypothetical protein
MNSHAKDSARLAAIDTAAAVISGRVGTIEGCRTLSSLAHDLVPDWRVDEDFVIFCAVASETDALPTGTARKHWAPAALAREDQEIKRAEQTYRDAVVAACHNIIARFQEETDRDSV